MKPVPATAGPQSSKPRCLIVDDEPIARKGLAEDLTAIGLITVQATAADAIEAAAVLEAQPIDVLFLDIELDFAGSVASPSDAGASGLDLLKNLPLKPLVILVTAYPQYALLGYDHGVIDYLVKPVSPQRLRLACEKAVEQHSLRSAAIGPHLFLKCNGVLERVATADILCIEAANNYIQVHLPGKKLLVYQSLKGIEEQLPDDAFIQVHKSFLVALRHIRRIEGNSILMAAPPGTPPTRTIPLSRRFKSSVLARLHLTNKPTPLA